MQEDTRERNCVQETKEVPGRDFGQQTTENERACVRVCVCQNVAQRSTDN